MIFHETQISLLVEKWDNVGFQQNDEHVEWCDSRSKFKQRIIDYKSFTMEKFLIGQWAFSQQKAKMKNKILFILVLWLQANSIESVYSIDSL